MEKKRKEISSQIFILTEFCPRQSEHGPKNPLGPTIRKKNPLGPTRPMGTGWYFLALPTSGSAKPTALGTSSATRGMRLALAARSRLPRRGAAGAPPLAADRSHRPIKRSKLRT